MDVRNSSIIPPKKPFFSASSPEPTDDQKKKLMEIDEQEEEYVRAVGALGKHLVVRPGVPPRQPPRRGEKIKHRTLGALHGIATWWYRKEKARNSGPAGVSKCLMHRVKRDAHLVQSGKEKCVLSPEVATFALSNQWFQLAGIHSQTIPEKMMMFPDNIATELAGLLHQLEEGGAVSQQLGLQQGTSASRKGPCKLFLYPEIKLSDKQMEMQVLDGKHEPQATLSLYLDISDKVVNPGRDPLEVLLMQERPRQGGLILYHPRQQKVEIWTIEASREQLYRALSPSGGRGESMIVIGRIDHIRNAEGDSNSEEHRLGETHTNKQGWERLVGEG